MGARLYHTLTLAAFVGSSLPVTAQEKTQGTTPRSWTAFYAGSSNYTGAAGGLNATRYGVSLGSDLEFGEGWLAGGSISIGKQHFDTPDSSGDSNDFFSVSMAVKPFWETVMSWDPACWAGTTSLLHGELGWDKCKAQ